MFSSESDVIEHGKVTIEVEVRGYFSGMYTVGFGMFMMISIEKGGQHSNRNQLISVRYPPMGLE
jgi:hypothetical protein